MESLPTARVLMLVNHRPEYQHRWGSKTYYRQLRIDPLPAVSAHQLLDNLLGDDPTVRTVEGAPHPAHGWNAVLPRGRGADAGRVPATVKALLAARIDRLTSEERAVLQAASVVGTDVQRLWQRQGKRPEAAWQLTEIYNWFTEGFDTADLREARLLL